jgi:Amt family ammonium transporter
MSIPRPRRPLSIDQPDFTMRLRTKFFLVCSSVVVLLCAGAWWPVQRTIQSSSDNMAAKGFAGARQSLQTLQTQRVDRMRQACALVMNIPELRALIAESNYEVAPENIASLQERLDSLGSTIGVSFFCVLDQNGALIAQNHGSPWPTLAALNSYLHASPQAGAMIRQLFSAPGHLAHPGLWTYHGALYRVVGMPLFFNSTADQPAQTDGALIMAEPVTDQFAVELGNSHACQVSFVADGAVAASSLSGSERAQIVRSADIAAWPTARAFDMSLQSGLYRSWLEPMIDDCSGNAVGGMLIQSSLADVQAQQREVSRSLLLIAVTGLAIAAVMSFVLSGAITRPLAELVGGVRAVAGGDLERSLRVTHRDELGELAGAFNDMVVHLRTRRELQRLVEESQAASKAKSEFLANMSHEIRTPLNGVIGMADLLLRTGLTERQQRYAGLVRSSGHVLMTLLNDVLDFSKIEAGKLEVEEVDFDLHATIEDAVEILSQKAFAKGLEVICDIQPGVPAATRGDPTRLRQILMNLLTNAMKFTAAGEIVVRATPGDTIGDKLLVHFAVTDTGIGIPPDRVDRLFKSFSQVDASTTRRFGGTGLGLAICKQLAELMGGKIGVTSEPGKGATFWFTVALGHGAAEPPVQPTLANLRVLVVDNNQSNRMVLRDQLLNAGADACVAAEAAEAIEALATAAASGRAFDLVLLDNRATARQISQDSRFSHIRLLLVARPGEEIDRADLAAAGLAGCIGKPIRRKQLLAALQSSGAAESSASSGAGVVPSDIAKAAKGRFRLLLAEDNEVNQLVAVELLAEAGYRCDVVTDGKQAVDAIAAGGYDLALMDCQMPVMDGFDAVRAIREAERSAAVGGVPPRHIPILALTANAGGGDRERCLEAGMDDYCPKPFDPQQLLGLVESLLPIAATSPSAITASAPIIESPDSPFDLGGLLRRCTGKKTLAVNILTKFEKQSAAAVSKIEGFIAGNDAEGLSRAAHVLKGTAGVVAAEQVRRIAEELETMGRVAELSRAQSALENLRGEVERCAEYVRSARFDAGFAKLASSPT